MTQVCRLSAGGNIDRTKVLSFRFDGRLYEGFAGDTLASALLANNVHLVGRSFKYHRPRGIVSAGVEEPNALVTLREGNRAEPNTRATTAELYDGLIATSQNRWPSLGFDIGAVNDLFSRFIPAGFYYKTFIGSTRSWMFFEHFIRKAAGMGRATTEPDPDTYEKSHAHCDVLVVGSGPAGIAAALAAGRAGARVLLLEQLPQVGGSLSHWNPVEEESEGRGWSMATLAELHALPNVRMLVRTTAFGYYDHNLVAAAERVSDHLPQPSGHAPRQRLWLIRARRVVIAAGAIERPLVFPGNDRPGVMLASAVSSYVNGYAVLPGRRAVVLTNNDNAYRTALDLKDAGAEVAAVIDTRASSSGPLARQVRAAGIKIIRNGHVSDVSGRLRVTGITVNGGRIACDLVATSGGWTPSIHLHSQAGGQTRYDIPLAAYVPSAPAQGSRSVGAAAGVFHLAALRDGWQAGCEAAEAAGLDGRNAGDGGLPECDGEAPMRQLLPLAADVKTAAKCFVDLQDDVTLGDIALAAREGLDSIEHVKRYTTLGMGTDQGKTASMAGLAALAEALALPMQDVGQTRFRPPFTPTAMGLFAHREVGRHFQPIRRTAMHAWHEQAGAAFVEAGLWLRPRAYPKSGESLVEAIRREARQVRDVGGIVDVSTLGKIEIIGDDAAEFLNRVYVNAWKALEVGKVRYGLMLREDGIAYDDGTTARLSENRYVMTTTTANAVKVLQNLEFYSQLVWPELDVDVCSVTEQWAAMAIAGPKARELLAMLVDIDVSDAALPYMGYREARVAEIPVRVFRISYSGELAYEINVPAHNGHAVWDKAISLGIGLGIVPYGTEAMGILRIEKGHPAGPELDGRTTAADLAMARLVSRNKPFFVGSAMMDRPGLADPARPSLVGLVPVVAGQVLRAGSYASETAVADGASVLGHLSSACFSPNLGHHIALAFVKGGMARLGQEVFVLSPLHGETVRARIVSPVFIDPEGKKLHG